MSKSGVFAGEFNNDDRPGLHAPYYVGAKWVSCGDPECHRCIEQEEKDCPICGKDDSEGHTCLAQD